MEDPNVICTMSGMKYRAAFVCHPKNDYRYYLNGLHISAANKELAATDGSILYIADIEPGEALKDIIFSPAKIPANIETVVISEGRHPQNILIECTDSRGNQSQYICKLIDGTYPDYRAIMRSKNDDAEFHKISWSAKYLGLLKAVFGNKATLVFEIPHANCAVTISDTTDYSNGKVLLMPCKV